MLNWLVPIAYVTLLIVSVYVISTAIDELDSNKIICWFLLHWLLFLKWTLDTPGRRQRAKLRRRWGTMVSTLDPRPDSDLVIMRKNAVRSAVTSGGWLPIIMLCQATLCRTEQGRVDLEALRDMLILCYGLSQRDATAIVRWARVNKYITTRPIGEKL